MSEDTGQAADEQQQDAGAQEQTADDQTQAQQDTTPDPAVDFDGWLKAQPEAVRKGYRAATSGLKSALDKERDTAAANAKELRAALKKLDGVAGAEETVKELEARLDEAEKQRDAASRRAEFVVSAISEGIVDAELAWRAIDGNDALLDRRGNVDFAKLKSTYPVLFRAEQQPRGNAGAGQAAPPPDKADMNTFIREKARGG